VTALGRGLLGGLMLAGMVALIVVEAVAAASTWPGRVVLRATESIRGMIDR
jgi:hypothetical protein